MKIERQQTWELEQQCWREAHHKGTNNALQTKLKCQEYRVQEFLNNW
jgi:hypothetical protein